jgi:hypothetical protein
MQSEIEESVGMLVEHDTEPGQVGARTPGFSKVRTRWASPHYTVVPILTVSCHVQSAGTARAVSGPSPSHRRDIFDIVPEDNHVTATSAGAHHR